MTPNGRNKQIEITENAIAQLAEATRADDPAPSPTYLPMERTLANVRNISATASDELRKLRDEADQLLRTIALREDALSAAIREHAKFSEDAILSSGIMMESMVKLRQHFEGGLPPAPPTVSLPSQHEQRQ